MLVTKSGVPVHCEFCGSELFMDGVNLVCQNPSCPNTNTEKIKAWCLNIAPIEGLGWKTIEKIMGYLETPITSVKAIYDLDWEAKYLLQEVSTERKLFNQMMKALHEPNITVDKFLLALKIPGVGKKGAERLAENHAAKNILDDIANDGRCYLEQLAKILQDRTATHALYFAPEYHSYFVGCYNLVESLLIYSDDVKAMAEEAAEEAAIIEKEKKTVVITGKVKYGTRAEYTKKLKSWGYEVGTSVTKNTFCLITDNPKSGTLKNKKAKELGVKVLTQEEFDIQYGIF